MSSSFHLDIVANSWNLHQIVFGVRHWALFLSPASLSSIHPSISSFYPSTIFLSIHLSFGPFVKSTLLSIHSSYRATRTRDSLSVHRVQPSLPPSLPPSIHPSIQWVCCVSASCNNFDIKSNLFRIVGIAPRCLHKNQYEELPPCVCACVFVRFLHLAEWKSIELSALMNLAFECRVIV